MYKSIQLSATGTSVYLTSNSNYETKYLLRLLPETVEHAAEVNKKQLITFDLLKHNCQKSDLVQNIQLVAHVST